MFIVMSKTFELSWNMGGHTGACSYHLSEQGAKERVTLYREMITKGSKIECPDDNDPSPEVLNQFKQLSAGLEETAWIPEWDDRHDLPKFYITAVEVAD